MQSELFAAAYKLVNSQIEPNLYSMWLVCFREAQCVQDVGIHGRGEGGVDQVYKVGI